MHALSQRFQQALAEKTALKVIAGISNFDAEAVLRLARATEAVAQGTPAVALDVAARPELILAARAVFSGPIVASSVDPRELKAAVGAGADVAELGNFDALYDNGYFISAEEVLRLAKETMTLVGEQALISITVPGHLSTDAQVALAQALEGLGVDVIQTEGAARVLSETPTMQALSREEKADITVRNTRALVRASVVPVMTASGMTADTLADAFAAGASAVGVGRAVNQLATQAEMEAVLQTIVATLAATRRLSHVS